MSSSSFALLLFPLLFPSLPSNLPALAAPLACVDFVLFACPPSCIANSALILPLPRRTFYIPPKAVAVERADAAEQECRRLRAEGELLQAALADAKRELREQAAAAEAAAAEAAAAAAAAAALEAAAAAAAAAADKGDDGDNASAKQQQQQRPPPERDVVALNVSGQEMWATRATLCALPGSGLARMFGGEDGEDDAAALALDERGRVFL